MYTFDSSQRYIRYLAPTFCVKETISVFYTLLIPCILLAPKFLAYQCIRSTKVQKAMFSTAMSRLKPHKFLKRSINNNLSQWYEQPERPDFLTPFPEDWQACQCKTKLLCNFCVFFLNFYTSQEISKLCVCHENGTCYT